jgi:hypothetical protein
MSKCLKCDKTAYYNVWRVRPPLYCRAHKEDNMYDVIHNMCRICRMTRATFGYVIDGITRARRCKAHREDDMVDVVNKTCVVCHKKQPNFGYKKGKATHCATCRKVDMGDVTSKMCIVCGEIVPTFGYEKGKATHCAACKEDDMVDVKHELCIKCGKIRPAFGYEKGKGTHCDMCKEDDMLNVVSKMCEKCNKIVAAFGYEKGKPTHCNTCRENDMVDVKSVMCKICNKKQPVFGYEKGKATHCSTCKEDDMVDVKDRLCEICGKHAYYNLPNLYPKFCYNHKLSGMIRNPRRLCEYCKNIAIYGTTVPVHCEKHSLENEYNLCEYNCPQCGRLDILNKHGICINFCSLEEVDRAMKKRIKKKEEEVIKLLSTAIITQNLVEEHYDIQINSCDRYRPDILYHCGSHVVIVEIDEKQHKSYSCQSYIDCLEDELELTPCEALQLAERTRMYLIAVHFEVPTVFLRYNPDKYKIAGKNQVISEKDRKDILVRWVKKCISTEPVYSCSAKYLFYDEFEKTDISFQEISVDNIYV